MIKEEIIHYLESLLYDFFMVKKTFA